VIAIVIGVVVAAGEAWACDRAVSALEKAEVAAAIADVIVVGEVTAREKDGTATVTVSTVMKGVKKVGDSLRIRGVTWASLGDRCSNPPIDVGKRFVFLLWSPAGKLAAHFLVDGHGGVAEATTANEKTFRDALAKAHPRSAWSTKGDVSSMLVLDPDPDEGEVDVFVLFRNVGAKSLAWKYTAWPRATQTKCVLSIVNVATKQKIAARGVPIAKKDIEDYFGKNNRKWEANIEPGTAQLFRLPRITTAKSGWGYKEELGFVFYPVAKPGAHEVSADCVNTFGAGKGAATAAVTLTL
jgi:hypothetical protein